MLIRRPFINKNKMVAFKKKKNKMSISANATVLKGRAEDRQ